MLNDQMVKVYTVIEMEDVEITSITTYINGPDEPREHFERVMTENKLIEADDYSNEISDMVRMAGDDAHSVAIYRTFAKPWT